jgi:hypothetical protein
MQTLFLATGSDPENKLSATRMNKSECLLPGCKSHLRERDFQIILIVNGIPRPYRQLLFVMKSGVLMILSQRRSAVILGRTDFNTILSGIWRHHKLFDSPWDLAKPNKDAPPETKVIAWLYVERPR